MERREFIALLGMATAMMPSPARAQSTHPHDASAVRLIGAWSFVSSTNIRKDGTTFDRWGSSPRGILMFDRGGHYAQILMGSESKVFGAKVFCAYGTYALDEAKNVLSTQVVGCSVAKFAGTVQNREIVVLTADELKYSNPSTAIGTTAEAHWKRMT